MKTISHLLFSLNVLVSVSVSQTDDHTKLDINCKTCHACEVPTKDDPCLFACPRFSMTKEYPSFEEITNVIVMDYLNGDYSPVVFPHKLHAQMSEMTGGCLGCHHYNTLGPILSCGSCHSTQRQRDDVRVPDLKAAYHQKCLGCHRQWSRQTECISCHQIKNTSGNVTLAEVESELKMKSHPPVKIPEKIIYQTDYKKGSVVTFYHNDHSALFNLDCVSCHKNENCIRCHDVEKTVDGKNGFYDKPIEVNLPEEEQHKRCSGCHKKDKCTNCHSDKEKKSFDHKLRSGWTLNRYHEDLSCLKCHRSKTDYSGLESNCNSCHFDWKTGTFNHKITGLILNDTHIEVECEDCHSGKDFSIKPGCDNCHDEKSYPIDLPGKMVKNNLSGKK